MKKAPEKEIPAVCAAGSYKSNFNITLASNNSTPRQSWRARVPFKFLPVSAELLASKLFREAKR